MTEDRRHRPQQGRGPNRPEGSGSASQLVGKIKLGAKPLDPELFNGVAKDSAKKVAFHEDGRPRNENKPTQLRRFYDELVLWETRVNRQPEKFQEYLPFIRMINAKTAYAEGRKPKLVDQTFVDLMRHTLSEVTDAGSLTACKLFWEAFMGFYKQVRQD
jgi:CRISPR-associated protein Csm2